MTWFIWMCRVTHARHALMTWDIYLSCIWHDSYICAMRHLYESCVTWFIWMRHVILVSHVHICVRHVTHYECIMSYIWMGFDTHERRWLRGTSLARELSVKWEYIAHDVNTSCHTYESLSHIWMSHTYKCATSHILMGHVTCHVTSHIWIQVIIFQKVECKLGVHCTHMHASCQTDESCHTYKWVSSHR